MRASAYSPSHFRRHESSFAAGERAHARPAQAQGGRTRARREGTRLGAVGALAFAAALTGALCIGRSNSEDGHLAAESGAGFWLGLVGASTMLVLLLYPMREWMKARRRL